MYFYGLLKNENKNNNNFLLIIINVRIQIHAILTWQIDRWIKQKFIHESITNKIYVITLVFSNCIFNS